VLIRSKASNLAAGSFTGTENLFVRDMQAGTNYVLTTSGVGSAAMTPDGRFVAYVNSSGTLYVWATGTATALYTNSTGGLGAVAISRDGSRIAYWVSSTPARLLAVDLTGGTTWTIMSNSLASHPGLRFSADNRFLAYAVIQSNTNQVYLYDCLGGTNLLLSHNNNSSVPAYGSSDSPDISADGRFVAYRSAAPNIVPGDTNGVPDIFLFDRQTGATTLLSASCFGNFAADNRSLCPVFSGDGQTLVLQTWASDLVSADFNQASDVVGYSIYASGSIPVFYAAILPGGAAGAGPWITWQAAPGGNYRVQFKNSLSDSDWQELGGNVTFLGNQGYCQDLAPAATGRFYRVVGQ
jgi:Tol biopolymer transport system component